jgi:triosephosphate isomerase
MRKKIVAGNWKMFKSPTETRDFFKDFNADVQIQTQLATTNKTSNEVIFFVPAYDLEAAIQSTQMTNIKIGAQNAFAKKEGAFTGENSPWAVKSIGAQYLLIGHSERRAIFGETNSQCLDKVNAALEAGLIPMLCVGETLAEREKNQTWSVVASQLDAVFSKINNASQVVVAYEPVWAIGTGKVATPEQAQEVHKQIREHLKLEISILYGGSVKSENAATLANQPDIDGFLVGGASLVPKDFSNIVKAIVM